MKMWVPVGLLVILACCAGTSGLSQEVCDVSELRSMGPKDATAYIGLMYSLRTKGDGTAGCGPYTDASIQALEAVLWAISRINQHNGTINGRGVSESYIPGIKLGVIAREYCGNPSIALSGLMDMYPHLAVGEGRCNASSNKMLLGVIGPDDSGVALPVAEMAGEFSLPLISYSAAARSLSDKTKYPTFMRTVPPEKSQVKVIMDVLKKLQWGRIGVIYNDDLYGQNGKEALLLAAKEHKICVAAAAQISEAETSVTRIRDSLKPMSTLGVRAVVFFGSSHNARRVLKAFSGLANGREVQWIFADSIGADPEFGQSGPWTRGSLSIASAARMVHEFEDYLVRIDYSEHSPNAPWRRGWYMTKYNCSFPGVTEEPYANYPPCKQKTEGQRRSIHAQDSRVEPAIAAVYTFAKALRNAHANLCGFNNRGACKRLQALTPGEFFENYLKEMDLVFTQQERVPSLASSLVDPFTSAKRVQFDPRGDPAEPDFIVYNYNNRSGIFKYERVGLYINGRKTLTTGLIQMYDISRSRVLPQLPVASCPPGGCTMCKGPRTTTRPYAYIPGDVLFVAVLSLHSNAGGMQCGDLDPSQVQLAQAFLYSIEKVNRIYSIFAGLKIGAVIFDDCGDPNLLRRRVTDFHDGTFEVEEGGIVADPRMVAGYVGGASSRLTGQLARLLHTEIKVPLVSFGSTRAMLRNRMEFPTFTSTIATADQEARALALVAQRLGYTHIQAIVEDSDDRMADIQELKRAAGDLNICVINVHKVTAGTDMKNLVEELYEQKDTRAVAVYLSAANSRLLLEAVNTAGRSGEFVFLGTGEWGDSASIVSGLEDSAKGSVTVKVKAPSVADFENYINNIDPSMYTTNPWFREYYQDTFQCYFDDSDTKGYTKPCTNFMATGSKITETDGYLSNPHVPYLSDAVYALAYGNHGALTKFCDAVYTRICLEFIQAKNRYEAVVQEIQAARFTDPWKTAFRFKDGLGSYGFDILSVTSSGYEQVGEYNYISDSFSLDKNKLSQPGSGSVRSRCPGKCGDCSYLYSLSEPVVTSGDINIAALLDLHEAGSESFSSCGKFDGKTSVPMLAALQLGVSFVNSGAGPVKLNGVKLGTVVADVCSSGIRAQETLLNMYSGSFMGKDQESGMSMRVNPSSLAAVLTTGTKQTAEVNKLLRKLQGIQITPGSTGVDLGNSTEYPNLVKMLPAHSTQSKAIAAFLVNMAWRYVRVVFGNDAKYKEVAMNFKKVGREVGVCSLELYEVGVDGKPDDLIDTFRSTSTTVVVVFASLDEVVELIKAKQRLPNNVMVVADTGVAPEAIHTLTNKVTNNIIFFNADLPPMLQLDKALDSINLDENPGKLFLEYYQYIYQCNLGSGNFYSRACTEPLGKITEARGYVQENTGAATLASVFAFASALSATLREVCGEDYEGVCPTFANDKNKYHKVAEKMANVEFELPDKRKMTMKDSYLNTDFVVRRYNRGNLTPVGSYLSGAFSLTDGKLKEDYQGHLTPCGDICRQACEDPDKDNRLSVIPGDIYLAGLFDVHKRGDRPFSCGDIQPDRSVQLVEAFNFAIEQVNNKQGIFKNKLRGLKLGGIAFDTCSSTSRASLIVGNLETGANPVKVGGKTISPDMIDVFISGSSSEQVSRISSILDDLDVPQISYGATSSKLSNKNKYPNFFRTVPGDRQQAAALVALLKRFNLELVQVVSSVGMYGEEASADFINHAEDNRICIAQHVIINSTDPSTSIQDAIKAIGRKKTVDIVVVILDTEFLNQFLREMSRTRDVDKFIFIGSETWADRTSVLDGVAPSLEEALSVGVETADVVAFDTYLESKTPGSYSRNPWFDEYYEHVYGCTLTQGAIGSTCKQVANGIPRAENYKQDKYVLYTVNAVFSAALGIQHALERKCGITYSAPCTAFFESTSRHKDIVQGIRGASFIDATSRPFSFRDGGVSSRGYHVYSVKKSPRQQYYYENIGSYNASGGLRSLYRVTHDKAVCGLTRQCQECPSLTRGATRHMQRKSPADLNLVALFDIHQAGNSLTSSCGKMNIGNGFLNLVSFFYAINEIGKDASLNNIKLGGLALDSCSNPISAKSDMFSFLSGRGLCGANNYDATLDPATVLAYITMGGGSTDVALDMLQSQNATIISPSDSSASLTGTPYFLRTVPPASESQAVALATVGQELGLTYIALLVSNNDYGRSLEQAFYEASDICVAQRYSLSGKDSAMAMVKNITKNDDIKALFLFTTVSDSREVMQAIRLENVENRFIIVASDAVGGDPSLLREMSDVSRGAVVMQVESPVVPDDFKTYIKSLSLTDRGGIPDIWFDEFWQHLHRCHLENVVSTMKTTYRMPCRDDAKITDDMLENDLLPTSPYLMHTYMATYLVAYGLNKLEKECKVTPLATCLAEMEQDRNSQVFDKIKNSQVYLAPNGKKISLSLTSKGDGSLGYKILNVQLGPSGKGIRLVEIGEQSGGGTPKIDRKKIKWYSGNKAQSDYPTSICTRGDVICAECHNNGVGGRIGSLKAEAVNSNMEFSRPFGIVVTVLSAIGIIVTVILFIYLIVTYPFLGGTSVLGFLLLIGVLLIYVLNFAFIVQPGDASCGIRRFCLGLVYALCFACLLVKTLNTWRLQTYSDECIEPSYRRIAHPCGLFMITIGLTIVQVIIAIEWLVLEPTTVESDVIENMSYNFCSPMEKFHEQLVISCVYPMFLILMTFIFSAVTWDSKENHRESRWILFATAATIGIWLIWTVIATTTDQKYRDPAIILANIVNATVILLCMYVRKIYLLSRYQEDEKRSRYSGPPSKGVNDFTDTYGTGGYITDSASKPSHPGSGVIYVDNAPHVNDISMY